MHRSLFALVLVLSLAGCDESSSTPSRCSPPGFTTCSGNELVTCEGIAGEDAGMTLRVDCTATSRFCVEASFTEASCTAPVLGEPCFGRDTVGCGEGDQLLRCVWLSEQPEPGFSGDVGIWRVQTDCSASSQVCAIPAAACSAP